MLFMIPSWPSIPMRAHYTLHCLDETGNITLFWGITSTNRWSLTAIYFWQINRSAVTTYSSTTIKLSIVIQLSLCCDNYGNSITILDQHHHPTWRSDVYETKGFICTIWKSWNKFCLKFHVHFKLKFYVCSVLSVLMLLSCWFHLSEKNKY